MTGAERITTLLATVPFVVVLAVIIRATVQIHQDERRYARHAARLNHPTNRKDTPQ